MQVTQGHPGDMRSVSSIGFKSGFGLQFKTSELCFEFFFI